MRGAWIEILDDVIVFLNSFASLPVRGAWIEITLLIPSLTEISRSL